MANFNVQQQISRRMTIAKTVLIVAFIVVAVWYVMRRLPEFRSITMPSWQAVLAVIFSVVSSVFFRSLYNYYTGRHLGANLSLPESFMLSAVVTAGNVVLPANPGASFRAVYMKRVHAFPYSYFASSVALYAIITTLMMSLFCVLLLLLIQIRQEYFRADLLLVLPVIAFVAFLFLVWRQRPSGGDNRSIWSALKASYLDFVGTRRLVAASVLIVTSNFLVISVVWVVVLREYAPGISILEAALFGASQIVSGLVNLTPGAAGFQELVGIYVGTSMQFTMIELFAILIWVRLVRVLASIAIGIPSAIVLHLRSH